VRLIAFLAFLAAAPCIAQDLPDPGRRLSKEEQDADPEKRNSAKAPAPDPRRSNSPRDPQACERSRAYYQMSCGAPNSYRSRSMECAEAYALYRQSC
jgi:hypothetical protein